VGQEGGQEFIVIASIKSAIRSWLLPDLFAVKRTPDDELLRLIAKLRPVDCGFNLIRLGGGGDGGYLIPDDLEAIEYCFSPGVSNVSRFDNDLADRHIKSYLADYSVDGPSVIRPEFTFDKKYLGASDRDGYFTLETWKHKYVGEYKGDLLLQMDIEGAEYEVLLSTSDELLNQFRIAVIEFHALDRLFDPFTFRLVSACFEKLLASFYVIHIHPNNCCGAVRMGRVEIPRVMEFTFFNRRRVRKTIPSRAFPHELDVDNFSKMRPVVLPKCWYEPD